jgi:DNA-binding NtrC family response regulator
LELLEKTMRTSWHSFCNSKVSPHRFLPGVIFHFWGLAMKDEKRTILIVDDEEMVLEVEALMLERMGFKTLKANSSEKACQLYRDKKNNIDLVILDMIMPGDNGAVIYKKLKRINSGIRVLISSGFWKDINVKEILNDGHNSFIQKPFKFAEFNKKIDSILSTK